MCALGPADDVGIVPRECMDTVAMGIAVPNDRSTLDIVGDEDDVDVVDRGAEPWSGVVVTDV